MANNQSWEFYQQPMSGTKYPLLWIAGCANAQALTQFNLAANTLCLVPFNQMRGATLSQIGFRMVGAVQGAKARLGIYANNSNADNFPKGLVLDAGEVDLLQPPLLKWITNLSQALAADTRYWAAILTNGSGVAIYGLGPLSVLFWGVPYRRRVL